MNECKKRYSKLTNLIFYGHLDYVSARKNVGTRCTSFTLSEETLLNDGQTNTAQWMSPLKLFEYMASSSAIISSKLPVLEEILVNDTNALLASPGDLKDWQHCLKRLVMNKKLREKLSSNSYREFLQSYTWELRARKLIEYVT